MGSARNGTTKFKPEHSPNSTRANIWMYVNVKTCHLMVNGHVNKSTKLIIYPIYNWKKWKINWACLSIVSRLLFISECVEQKWKDGRNKHTVERESSGPYCPVLNTGCSNPMHVCGLLIVKWSFVKKRETKKWKWFVSVHMGPVTQNFIDEAQQRRENSREASAGLFLFVVVSQVTAIAQFCVILL